MSKLFQIHESDLETLEKELPALMEHASSPGATWNDRKDIQEAWDMVREIVSRVRWDYGPPKSVEKIE